MQRPRTRRIPRAEIEHDHPLAEQHHAFTRSRPWDVAVLPFGATEPHNLHLPYGTDTFEGEIIGVEICAAAHERGARVVRAGDVVVALFLTVGKA